MSKSRDMIIINATKFDEDFRSLNSSKREVSTSLVKAGFSPSVLHNWVKRADGDGNVRVNVATIKKLCEISGLTYEDYYIRPAEPTKAERGVCAPKVRSHRLKNGIRVTTYTKPNSDTTPKSEVEATTSLPQYTMTLHTAISNFRKHMVVYRKLLGITTTQMREDYGFESYPELEAGKVAISMTTYIGLSNTFLLVYNAMEDSPVKAAFKELASQYRDIYICSLFFGDTLKGKKNVLP